MNTISRLLIVAFWIAVMGFGGFLSIAEFSTPGVSIFVSVGVPLLGIVIMGIALFGFIVNVVPRRKVTH